MAKKLDAKKVYLKKKLRDWCEDNSVGVHAFLESINISPLQWYRFLQGSMPHFTTVSRIVRGTNGYISFEDFENALELTQEKQI